MKYNESEGLWKARSFVSVRHRHRGIKGDIFTADDGKWLCISIYTWKQLLHKVAAKTNWYQISCTGSDNLDGFTIKELKLSGVRRTFKVYYLKKRNNFVNLSTYVQSRSCRRAWTLICFYQKPTNVNFDAYHIFKCHIS